MDYLIRFILTKESVVEGKENSSKFPLTFIAYNVNSEEEALKIAKQSFSRFYIGDPDKFTSYSVQIEKINQASKETKKLKTNYYNFYKNLILDADAITLDNGERKVLGISGKEFDLKKEKFTNGNERITISNSKTSISYDTETDLVTFTCNPYKSSTQAIRAFYSHKYSIDEDANYNSIEDTLEKDYMYNPPLREAIREFMEELPQFSKKEIAKKQRKFEEEYEERLNKNQIGNNLNQLEAR